MVRNEQITLYSWRDGGITSEKDPDTVGQTRLFSDHPGRF